MPGPSRLPVDRFWDRVDKTGDCWLWTGATVRGYGVIRSGTDLLYVHRLAMGDVPKGAVVCHRCDNPPCVNPAHLFLGTQADNLRDAVAKGRTSHGEGRSNHKVSEDDVAAIRALGAAGVPSREIAERYPISARTVRKILARKNWRHGST